MTLALIAWAALIAMLIMRLYLGVPSGFTLLQHQRGVLYRRGIRVREVGPGRHRVWAGVEKILFVDTRPISVSFENRAVTLRDGGTAVFGFSGSAEIDNVSKALYAAGNYHEMPAFVLLCCARSALNNQPSSGIGARRDSIVEEVTKCATTRLSAAGFRLLTFTVTQLSVVEPVPPSAR